MANPSSIKHFKITNMGCVNCIDTINSQLINELNPDEIHFNLADKSLSISGKVNSTAVISSLKQLGYEATQITNENIDNQTEFETALVKKTIISMLVAIPLLLDMFYPLFPPITEVHGYLTYLSISLISVVVIAYSGGDIYRSAYNAFRHHHANMDTLVTIGTGSAWLYSTIVLLFSKHLNLNSTYLYFESAIVILAFINLGTLLESRAKAKSNQAIKKLIALQPQQATVIIDNEEVLLPISQVQQGQIIKVYPGEKVPVDGIITSGNSRIDESMLTGEPLAVKKQIDSQVFAGTLNTTGSFLFKVEHTQQDTALAKIIELVRQAQNTKPNISRLADTIAHYFVPTVLIIAILTALVWFNLGYSGNLILTTAMSVLVIACPCALGLATPIATICGIGKSAESGILIKNGQSLQVMSQLTDIVFDKTGTITAAKPAVVYSSATHNFDEETLISYAASLEAHSEHPLAQAILDQAQSGSIKPLEVIDFEVIEGFGVSGVVEGKQCLVGNRALMDKNNIELSAYINAILAQEKKGNSVVLVAYDQQLVGYFAVNDTVKPQAKGTIETIKKLNIKTHLISGDNQQAVSLLAKELGFDNSRGDCLPQDKANLIRQLKSEGKIIAMIGDGINDAPALSQADVGLAIGNGTDIAIESAEVVLLNESLHTISHAFIIAKATMRNIKQNLAGAFIYNLLGIPVAAGILYPAFGILLNPMLAGGAMAASSLTVVLNANRLRLLKLNQN